MRDCFSFEKSYCRRAFLFYTTTINVTILKINYIIYYYFFVGTIINFIIVPTN